MKPQIHRIIKLTEAQLVLKLHTAALMYSNYVDTTLLFIFSKGKESPYGVYEACLSGTIKKEDCSPTHSINNMYEKISVINNLLDFKHSKCYRMGEKDLITKDNDFELATGNNTGVIGYDHRISQSDSKKINQNKKAMPTTLLTTPITQLVSNPEKIMFILQKTIEEKNKEAAPQRLPLSLILSTFIYIPTSDLPRGFH